MEQPIDYEGPALEILVRDPKQDNTGDVISKIFSYVKGSKIGVFLRDKEDGDLTAQTLKAIDDNSQFMKVDMKDFMDKVHLTKIQPEIENLTYGAKFVKWTFDKIITEVEDIIDLERPAKHSQIQKKIEALLEKED